VPLSRKTLRPCANLLSVDDCETHVRINSFAVLSFFFHNKYLSSVVFVDVSEMSPVVISSTS
jgi:hypothetical protein